MMRGVNGRTAVDKIIAQCQILPIRTNTASDRFSTLKANVFTAFDALYET